MGTKVGDKYLCVVVKVMAEKAFVLTAYLTESNEERSSPMAGKNLKIGLMLRATTWRSFSTRKKTRITSERHRTIKSWKRVDDQGNILGFSVLRVSALKEEALEMALLNRLQRSRVEVVGFSPIRSVHHVEDANTIIIAHTGLERTNHFVSEVGGSGRSGFEGQRSARRDDLTTLVPYQPGQGDLVPSAVELYQEVKVTLGIVMTVS